jgi:acylphosphatase
MKQVHLLISGFVQGVGYREFVRSNANKMKITGWVRNLSDNRVEIAAQGGEEDLKKFIKICEQGPFLAEVKNIAIEWQEPQEAFTEFQRKPTSQKNS